MATVCIADCYTRLVMTMSKNCISKVKYEIVGLGVCVSSTCVELQTFSLSWLKYVTIYTLQFVRLHSKYSYVVLSVRIFLCNMPNLWKTIATKPLKASSSNIHIRLRFKTEEDEDRDRKSRLQCRRMEFHPVGTINAQFTYIVHCLWVACPF